MTEEPLQEVSVWRSRKINGAGIPGHSSFDNEEVKVGMTIRTEETFVDANWLSSHFAELSEMTEEMLDDEEARIREGKENVPVPRNRVKELTLEENNKIHDALQQPDPEYVCCPECGGTKKNPEDKR